MQSGQVANITISKPSSFTSKHDHDEDFWRDFVAIRDRDPFLASRLRDR